MISVHETITNSKAQLDKLLKSNYIEDSLLLGSLSFTQSKVSNFISADLSATLSQASEQGDLGYNCNELIDKIWLEFHYPVIKYFQAHFNKFKASKNKNHVETRKLFDNFHKFIKTFNGFYSQLLERLLTTYDLSTYIPTLVLFEKFNIAEDIGSPKEDAANLASNIVYLIHKSILSMADLSRYRSTIARNNLPQKSVSKKDLDFSVSLDLYKLCNLILPSFGDPFDHIAIIDNTMNHHFNMVYHLLRSVMSRIPSSLGFKNLLKMLAVQHKENSILKEYKDISTITDPNKINSALLLELQFLCLFNYHFLPLYWKLKDGKLINGVPVKDLEGAFFENLADCDFKKKARFSDMIYKQLIMLMSGLHILTDKTNTFENEFLIKDNKMIGAYLKFFFKYVKQIFQITLQNWKEHGTDKLDLPLLSSYRIILNWLKECKLGYQYMRHNKPLLLQLCEVLNFQYQLMSENSENIAGAISKWNSDFVFEDLSSIVFTKFKRQKYFAEDVSLKEFTPIGNYLKDFHDAHLFSQSESNCLRLIGKAPKNEFEENYSSKVFGENSLRLAATARLGQALVLTSIKHSDVGIKFNSNTVRFEFEEKLEIAPQPLSAENQMLPVTDVEDVKKLPDQVQNIKAKRGRAEKKAASRKSVSPRRKDVDPLERIQQTIAQYQQIHDQEQDVFSLLKNSIQNATSVNGAPLESPALAQNNSEHSGEENEEYSDMVDSLLNEVEERPATRMDPPVSKNFQPTPVVPQNSWSIPSLQSQSQSPAPLQPNGLGNQQYDIIEANQRQFFAQGVPNQDLSQSVQQNQQMYQQYFSDPVIPSMNPPIPQLYQQYPQFYNPTPPQSQDQQRQNPTPNNGFYPQYGH